jgi:hypothetical protein
MRFKYIISANSFTRAMFIAQELNLSKDEILYVQTEPSCGVVRRGLLGITVEHESQLIGEFSNLERDYLTRRLRQTNQFYKKKTLLEVLKELPNGDRVVCNKEDYSDIWVIPKQTFLDTYESVN